jgi:5-methyltetrahydrofolate--homocysteine methyltransferase
LIGGATTSAKHTSVKIAPAYKYTVIHVKDASRSVGVVERLVSREHRAQLDRENRATQEKEREAFAKRRQRKLVSYAEAVHRRFQIKWQQDQIPIPSFLGAKTLSEFPLGEIVPYLDWSPFFMAWELPGKYPQILKDAKAGKEATKLFNDAQALLRRIVNERLLKANAVYGFYPANSEGDDIVVYTDEGRTHERCRFPMLRQQWEREGQTAFRSLADYIAPVASGLPDHLGAFAVTAGEGVDELVKRFEADHDDYNAIMTKALADRLAEAFAELLHQRARREWGYGKGEKLTPEQLIGEEYQGIRPAAGYPSCPDHTEKATLWKLLGVDASAGIHLTESYAMTPAASVSGLYFAHPQATYFAVDLVTRDQVENYSARKHLPRSVVERWLAPNLGYDVE